MIRMDSLAAGTKKLLTWGLYLLAKRTSGISYSYLVSADSIGTSMGNAQNVLRLSEYRRSASKRLSAEVPLTAPLAPLSPLAAAGEGCLALSTRRKISVG